MKYERWDVVTYQTISDQVIAVCAIKPRYTSLGLRPLLLTQFRLYQMYLSSQSSVLAVILNQAIHQRALNLYQQLISEKAVTIYCHQGLFLCNTIYLIVDHFYFHQFSFEVILKYTSYVYHLITQFLLRILLLTQLCE